MCLAHAGVLPGLRPEDMSERDITHMRFVQPSKTGVDADAGSESESESEIERFLLAKEVGTEGGDAG